MGHLTTPVFSETPVLGAIFAWAKHLTHPRGHRASQGGGEEHRRPGDRSGGPRRQRETWEVHGDGLIGIYCESNGKIGRLMDIRWLLCQNDDNMGKSLGTHL